MPDKNLMTRRLSACLVFCCCLLPLLRLGAQQPASPAAQQVPVHPGAPTIVKNVNEVSIVFSAVDKRHRLITGLKPSMVQVYDDKHLQKITRFVTQGNLPLRVALLMDTSNSIRDRFRFEQQAASDFFGAVIQKGRDQGMLVAFDSSLQVVNAFTDDPHQLARGIRSLRPGGGTALYDAVYYTAHDKLMPGGNDIRKVIIIISDGADDQSRVSLQEAIEMAENAGAIVYCIGTEPTGSDPQSDDVLKKLADETGGRSFFPFEVTGLDKAFQSILFELRNQYIVSYQPDDFVANGAFHPVDVKIALHDVKARARKGYYATATP